MKKVNAIMFGGVSTEHDISIITACLQQGKGYKKIYVDKKGVWWSIKGNVSPAQFVKKTFSAVKCTLLPNDNTLYMKFGFLFPLYAVDYALLCFHGGSGECGHIQGLLDMCGIAYSGCDSATSGICYDKALCKTFLKGLNIPVADGFTLEKDKVFVVKDDTIVLNTAKLPENIEYPVIVKPSRQGSSIGIGRADDIIQLENALRTAFCYDTKVIVEKYLAGATDLNIAVLKKKGEYILSELEKPQSSGIFTFENKYTQNRKSLSLDFVEHSKKSEIVKSALTIAENLSFGGVVRIDILAYGDNYVVNEINTIPGSLAQHLFVGKISRKEFWESLRQDALERRKANNEVYKTFSSSVLEQNFSAVKK